MTAADPALSRTAPPPPRYYRWLVLVFISLAMFGNYYVYDSIAPVADLLKEQRGFTDEQIGLLFTSYSVAAVLVLLIGGYIIDRWGTKKSTFLFGAICVVAGVVTALAPDFLVMIAGRVLLGLGAEPLIVAVTTALAKWFKGKELSFAFGINLTIARLGSWSADLSPSWATPFYVDWQQPLVLASFIAAFCVVGAGLYWIMESRAESRYSLGPQEETEKLDLGSLYRFSKSYWYVVGLCVVFYSAIFPFRAFAIKFFIEAHGVPREVGGFLNGMLPLAAMVATPLFGLLVDRVGRRSFFMAFGSLLLLPIFLMLAYMPAGAEITIWFPVLGWASVPIVLLIAMTMMGVAFSLIPAVMWPSVAYIVEQRRLGSAYALMTLCQQVGMAAIPWIIGRANDAFGAGPENPAGYNPGLWIFTGLAAFGLLFSFLLWKAETGPRAHGLETIRAGHPPAAGTPGAA
jgi:MFS family permease